MKRRDFFKTSIVASAAILGSNTALFAGETHQPIDNRKVSEMAFPEKRPLITYSDRPPLLESPRSTFSRGITENDEFFVRWHLPDIPTHIDTELFTIKIDGLVDQELEITLKELKEDF
jgi:sulfoxide reductase catalytic subunit YedY